MTGAITFTNLVKTYGKQKAVSDLSIEIQKGRITGFLGPNGAGKSTTLRCLVGLAKPTSGSAAILGAGYRDLRDPIRQVGCVLDSQGFHKALTGKQNLKIMAAAGGIPDSRVDEVLELGMKQRLALAGAILGDPEFLILDEPANGLDPLGIAWLRKFLRSLAGSGRTILVSSHQLAEMQNTVDDVIIMHKGKLITSGSMKEIIKDGTLEEAFLKLTEGVN